MKKALTLGSVVLIISALFTGCTKPSKQQNGQEQEQEQESGPAEQAINTLTEEEKAASWELLFDGKTTNKWRGYNKDSFPEKGWHIRDGNLAVEHSGAGEEGFGGDIITLDKFENFEFSLEFMVSKEGNSGILYRVVEKEGEPIWHNAPEYQILDDETYIENAEMDMKTHLTGDNYDLHTSLEKKLNPVGEWNHVRIIMNNNHVEHWLNGIKTVEYEIKSPEWEALVANSKFKDYPDYGMARNGHIGLQDHGHLIMFRNIKIRKL